MVDPFHAKRNTTMDPDDDSFGQECTADALCYFDKGARPRKRSPLKSIYSERYALAILLTKTNLTPARRLMDWSTSALMTPSITQAPASFV